MINHCRNCKYFKKCKEGKVWCAYVWFALHENEI